MRPPWIRALRLRSAGIVAGLVLVALGCGRGGGAQPPRAVDVPLPASAAAGAREAAQKTVPGLTLDPGHTVGAPRIVQNLAVFPVYAKSQEDLGDFTTLELALAKGTAAVREVGAEPTGVDPVNQAPQQASGGDGARVNTLVVENKGELPILVLAGTIMKGGKQDRQIGQDFVVGSRSTVPVDAFCVEHGRWTPTRDGVATGGRFETAPSLANEEVRAAGQYEHNQAEVWAKVGKVNAASNKAPASGTLMATLDDKEMAAARAELAAQGRQHLASAPQPGDVVGLAYAVDGDVRAIRWFLNAKMFQQYKQTLLETAAVDAVTAQANAKGAGRSIPSGAATPAAVVEFVTRVRTGRKEERDTAAENVNAYQFSDDGYSSQATMKPKGGRPAKAITTDFLKKQK